MRKNKKQLGFVLVSLLVLTMYANVLVMPVNAADYPSESRKVILYPGECIKEDFYVNIPKIPGRDTVYLSFDFNPPDAYLSPENRESMGFAMEPWLASMSHAIAPVPSGPEPAEPVIMDVTICVPHGTAPFDYVIDLWVVDWELALVGTDGIFAHRECTITVPDDEIPEFTTIAIPIAGILGLFFFFNYQKRRKK